MFIKTGTKHASKDRIELAVFEAFGEVLVEALSFGLGVAELVLVHGQTNTQSRKRNKSFIVELESGIIKIWSSG